jgi:pilus assembly protein CpaE
MIKVVVFDQRKKFVNRLIKSLKRADDFEIATVSTAAEAEAELRRTVGGILVIGPSGEIDSAAELAEKLALDGREIGCMLTTDKPTMETLQKALRAGFRDVVNVSDSDEMVAAVRRIHALIAPTASAPDSKLPAPVFTFLSIKGGVGKTVMLANTAVALAERKTGRILLLDLDDQFGDVGVMLGLQPERTVSDLIPVADRLDADMLESFLTRHKSGLEVLLAPVRYRQGERITERQLQRLCEAAGSAADIVLVDTPVSFNDNTLTLIEQSDYIFLVATLDVPSIKSAQIALQTLELLKFPKDNIKLLLNRADSKVALSPSDVERHLKHRIAVKIPSNLAVPRSVNEGEPLLADDKKSPVAQALLQIVALVESLEKDHRAKRAEKAVN